MVSVGAAIGLLVIVAVHTAVAAIVTRFFRVRLTTTWGWVVYATCCIPVILFVSTLLLSGVIGLGTGLGSKTVAITIAIALPTALGTTIDVFWMPHPDDVELPDTTG